MATYNLEKEKIQYVAFNKLKNSNFNGAILAATGLGKGRIISLSIEELYNQGNRSFLYCCNNQRLRDEDFPNELKKWLPETIFKNIKIEFECYQTVFRWTNKKYDVLIGDEFDAALSPKYINSFFNNIFKHKILFSGTLLDSKKELLKTIVPLVYEFSTVQAERRRIINKSIYYLYNYRLDEKEAKSYKYWTDRIRAGMACGDDPRRINYFTTKRKNVLYNSKSSIEHCRKIMNWLWGRDRNTRLVIFCERTEEADNVCKYSYHEGNAELDNLTRFQNEEIQGIAVVGKIKRGINLVRTTAAIYKSMNGRSTTEFDQRNGRLKRLPVDELATIIFMVPWCYTLTIEGEKNWKPTIVQEWISEATGNLTNIKFEHLKI